MTLYELTEQYQSLMELDQDDQAVSDTLEGLEGEITAKAENIAFVLANLDGYIDVTKSEKERLAARERSLKARKERLKDYLRSSMEAAGKKRIEGPLKTITCCAGRDSAVVDDVDRLPLCFVDKLITKQPRRKEILSALQEGKKVSGAHIEKTKSSILIK